MKNIKEIANSYAETRYPKGCTYNAYSGARNGFMAGYNFQQKREQMLTDCLKELIEIVRNPQYNDTFEIIRFLELNDKKLKQLGL